MYGWFFAIILHCLNKIVANYLFCLRYKPWPYYWGIYQTERSFCLHTYHANMLYFLNIKPTVFMLSLSYSHFLDVLIKSKKMFSILSNLYQLRLLWRAVGGCCPQNCLVNKNVPSQTDSKHLAGVPCVSWCEYVYVCTSTQVSFLATPSPD